MLSTRSRPARLAALTLFALGALAACGADGPTVTIAANTATTVPTTIVPRPTGNVDQLVTVRTARMHLHCQGTGDSTVVLIAGFTDGGDQWGPLQTALTGETRVCSYARFGTGTSDPAPSDQTFETEADDLRTLLATSGEPGPYVVVGHSFGGAQAVTFADRHAGDVAGLALIDASPPGWHEALCSVPDDGTEASQGFADLCASISDPTGNPERLDGPTAFAAVATIKDLGDLPMAVITAAERSLFAGTAASEVDRLTELWDAGQADWADLSTSSQVVTVEGVSHHVHLDRPDLVLDQIRKLLP